MRSTSTALIAAILVSSGVLFMHCSLGDLAGGSGAGNPGGSVSVALRAAVSLSTLKTAAEGLVLPSADLSPDSGIVVQDRAELSLLIDGIYLNGVTMKFLLDPSEDPRTILSDLRNRPSYLAADSQYLDLLEGPFRFNGLNGKAEPDIGTIYLPVAQYTGIKLSFSKERYYKSDATTIHRGQIYITGTLPYYGKDRRFIVEICRSFSSLYQFAGGGTFKLSASDTTHMELRFNAKKWFSSVDLKNAMDRGILMMNQYGEILIGSCLCPNNLTQEIETAIYNDFIASGKLVLY
jgi:hypothetical protein